MTYLEGKIQRKSLIVMGDLPKWKNTKIFQKGSHCVMGDLPRWKNTKIFQKESHCNE